MSLIMGSDYTNAYSEVNADLHSTSQYAKTHNSRMTFKDWLKQQLDEIGTDPTALSRLVDGLNQPTVQRVLSGGTGDPRIKTAAKIRQAVEIARRNAGLSPLSDTQIELKSAESNAEEGPALGRFRNVPVVGMAQLGDNGYWAELETPVGFGDGHIPFPTKSQSAYALRCRGDSMKPRIKNGEFVVVDPSLSPAPGDEVLVKATDGRVMVKELLYVRDDHVHLLSVNEAHGKLLIPLAEIEAMHGVAGIMPAHTWEKG